MKMKQSALQLVSVLSLLMLLGMNAHAYDGKMGKRFAKELELTPAQQKQVEAIKQTNMGDKAKHKEKMQSFKQQKRELLTNYSDAKANALAETSANMHKEKMLSRLKMQNEIYQILDDRQKILYQAMLEKKKKHKGHGKHKEKGKHHPKNCPHH